MLAALTIRDLVLVDRLDLSFRDSLCVLTGETGTGKSILLDALGLALGARADVALVRHGQSRATVSATFEPPAGHPAFDLLADHDIDPEDALVLRRTVGSDGRSRAFINDQSVSVGLLRQIGDSLVEVHGQMARHGLLDPAAHRDLLGEFGDLKTETGRVHKAWRCWTEARASLENARAAAAQARRDETFLRHAVSELDALDPRAEEEAELVNRRAVLANRERLIDGLRGALAELEREPGVDGSLRQVQRQLERIAQSAPGELNEALAALERAAIETEEALHALQAVADNVEHDETRLESVEERLFSLRDAARKHDVAIGALPALLQDLKQQLAAIDDEGDTLQRLDQESAASREVFERSAKKLSRARHKAARALDKAVNAELPPLRLERARFRTRLEALDETRWGANGIDRIGFEASTNPGMPMAPLARIASGGELARFMLAIKVVLAGVGACTTLIFDEVDAGIGGATADAVGERLARLAESRQVLVVTHSPQVAARGHQHLRVTKVPGTDGSVNGDDPVLTRVHELSTDERHEEIARMLSGARITTQARAAAASLIGPNGE